MNETLLTGTVNAVESPAAFAVSLFACVDLRKGMSKMMTLKKDLGLWNPKTNEQKTMKAGTIVVVDCNRKAFIAGEGFAPHFRKTVKTTIDGVAVEFTKEDFKAYVS